MQLNYDNYYSKEASLAYFSVSQFKAFSKCETAAMAELRGEYKPQRGRALLLGSLVDEMLTGTKETQDVFIEENFSELFKKNGDPYADVEKALDTVKLVQAQPRMMYYLDGEHQVIMTGEIEGVPFKIKMDSYKPGEFICDLKYMASLRSPNLFQPMVNYWGYDIQAAVYQEIVYQNTGKRLPFIFDVATKETPAHLALGEINQWNMDRSLDAVKKSIVHLQKVKNGDIEPARCEDHECDYCTSTKIITEPIDTDLFGLSRKQLSAMEGELP